MDAPQFAFEKVMIIDDTPIDRYVASVIIKKNLFAHELLEFEMATRAIEYLEENRDNPEMLPQIIFLDINMPQMDGFQFLEKLVSLPGEIGKTFCIVMLTSSLNPDDHERAANIPCVKKFINKPLNKDTLVEIANECDPINK